MGWLIKSTLSAWVTTKLDPLGSIFLVVSGDGYAINNQGVITCEVSDSEFALTLPVDFNGIFTFTKGDNILAFKVAIEDNGVISTTDIDIG